MTVAPALWKHTSRSRPPRSPAIALTSSSADSSLARITSACLTSTAPASVSRTPRDRRSTSWVPASRSSAAMCWLTADCVKLSASAAAEKEPCAATSRRTLMRRMSSISTAYRPVKQLSLGLMVPICEADGDVAPLPRQAAPAQRVLGRVVPVHQGRARGRRGAVGDRLDPYGARRAGAGAARRAHGRARQPPRPAWRGLLAGDGPGGRAAHADRARRGAHLSSLTGILVASAPIFTFL